MGKKKSKELGAAIKDAAAGGISKKEFQNIMEQVGVSSNQIVKRMDAINESAKSRGNDPYLSLNSGAANMLIREASKAPSVPAMPFMPNSQPFGSGQIAQSLQGRFGSPEYAGYTAKGQTYGAKPATPAQMMIGGTQIRPGGMIAVRGMGKSPRATGIKKGGGGGKGSNWGPYDGMDLTPSTPGVDPGPWKSGYVYPEGNGKSTAGTEPTATSSTPSTPSIGDAGSSMSIDGMTGGGAGMAGAVGLRRPKSRFRTENRSTKGTANFRRSLQIGSPFNFN